MEEYKKRRQNKESYWFPKHNNITYEYLDNTKNNEDLKWAMDFFQEIKEELGLPKHYDSALDTLAGTGRVTELFLKDLFSHVDLYEMNG